ncbi:Putative 2-dehydropantoate 2-reductase OS=Nostoc sp, (strain PCC 7120 / UTEX 2576) GN=all1319 PE=3 SV=1 [Rhizoctonia solani AG-1 IB]|uniref:2-dehydropantoate 2-reductase n=1 Tax=Thanatephorus cucumeris (strain AG1-IB / isolate 7/3/14) TaxID=1108050 RepID=A0A0B7FVV0_THACB|nr:Putative 2-dehydropantoate 2-reductase OS=Nostoc sp, (strain PCC 7120 / UTEX 2576) GN=all1319 PE=3 SV=1 [Rhizoctonia solani AG-1 IB]
MSQQERFLVFGLGGIGAVHALALTRAGHPVSAVARSNIESVRQNGLRITSSVFGDSQVDFEKVVSSAETQGTDVWTYVFVTTKALLNSSPSLPELLEPFVTEQLTTIVLIQNGVGIEDGVRARWPKNTIVSCVTWVGATQVSPGVVDHLQGVKDDMGLFTSDLDPALEKKRLERLASILTAGGLEVELLDNIQVRRWEKVTWNCAWNSLTALTNTNTLEWLTSSSDAEALSRDVMKEVITVAQGLGLNISFDLIDTLMDRVSGKALISSMQVDAANNRPMETEVIIGTPLRKARELGISTPILRTLYALLISKEKKYLGSS